MMDLMRSGGIGEAVAAMRDLAATFAEIVRLLRSIDAHLANMEAARARALSGRGD